MYNILHLTQNIPDAVRTSFTTYSLCTHDMIQVDIQLSQDNVVFISHKSFIGNKLLSNLYFHEIVELDPTIVGLKSFLETFVLTRKKILLHVNANHRFICAFLNKILTQYTYLNDIFIGSRNIYVLESMRRFNENYNLGLITKNILDNDILSYYIKKFDIDFVSFHWSALHPESIKYLRTKKVMVFGYTCKNNNTKSLIEEYKLDGIVLSSQHVKGEA